MGSLKGVDIQKGVVGPNASGSDTSISVLVFNGATIADFGSTAIHSVTRLKQAELLGITPANDITEDRALHQHVSEFFRMAGEGTKLWLLHTTQATPTLVFEDTNNVAARKVVTQAKGEIKQLALCWRPALAQPAISTITITAIGVNSNTLKIEVGNLTLGIYEKTADETTTALIAAAVAELITNNGFAATAAANVVSLATPVTQGGSLNGTSPVITAVGAIAATALPFAGGVAETLADGFNADMRAAIPAAQAFAEWAYSVDKPVHTILEGRAFTGTPTGATDLRALVVGQAELHATKVSIVIGQDYDYAESRRINGGAPVGSNISKYAAVGTFLGTLASAFINQSVGEVAVFNLSNAIKGRFNQAALSSHVKMEDLEGELEDLDTKGYIFPITYSGISGYRWNNDHVCAPIIIDEDGNINEHMIYFSRTIDYAAMELKKQLLPRVKSRVAVDPTTGKLPSGVRKSLEKDADKVFDRMAGKGLCVDGQTIINPDSDLITPPKSLLVDFELVPTNILDNITGTINLVKSFQI